MTHNPFQQIEAAIKMLQKSSELKSQIGLAYKRCDLAQSEFQLAVDSPETSKEKVEEIRGRLVSLFEAYLDAAIAGWSYGKDASSQIDLMKAELERRLRDGGR